MTDEIRAALHEILPRVIRIRLYAMLGRVFDLPAGYTANSSAGGIVDNTYQSVPEPDTSALASIALVTLAALRNARSATQRIRWT